MLKAALTRDESARLRDRAAPAIRTWTRIAIGDAWCAEISVFERPCADPDCPPLETVLLLAGPPNGDRLVRIPRPMRYLGPDDVACALRTIVDGEPEPDPAGACC